MGLLENEENNVDSEEPQYQSNQEDKLSPAVSKAEALNESFEMKKRNYVHVTPTRRPAQQNNTNKTLSLTWEHC